MTASYNPSSSKERKEVPLVVLFNVDELVLCFSSLVVIGNSNLSRNVIVITRLDITSILWTGLR